MVPEWSSGWFPITTHMKLCYGELSAGKAVHAEDIDYNESSALQCENH